MSDGTAMIAVDWGTTHARAWALGADGRVLAQRRSDDGAGTVPPGGFAAAFARLADGLSPQAPVVMAGMVGSRSGWLEAPYAATPCGADEVARAFVSVEAAGRTLHIAPGVDWRGDCGAYDVMRGEETKCLGAGVADGVLCLPGTHCKWVEMRQGRIVRFATFATGEAYAAMSGSFVARLAESPDDFSAAARGFAAAALPGGLLRALFQARTQALAGALPGVAVRPFISGLLIGHEVAGALPMFGSPARVHLVAAEPQLGLYRDCLAARGVEARALDPEAAFLTGIARLAAAAGLAPT